MIVSLVASPKSMFPLNVELPVTVRFPVIPAFSSTVRVSILAVPSMNRSCHSLSDVPRSLVPSSAGTRSLSKRPVAVIVSDVALPRSTSPLAVSVPDAVTLPVTFRSEPLNVRLPLSSIAPAVPASTTRPDVRSDTVAELIVDSPPETFIPPSTSRSDVT